LNIIFYKGFLIVQCLRDLVCYVIDLSEVPKCGSYNAYGNEQMDMQVEVERMDPEQIQTWLSSQNYNEQVMKDLRDVNGKMLFGYSEEQLVKIVGSAFGYAIWNSLHGLSSQGRPLASATHLTLSDFLPLERLPIVEPRTKPKRFIREEWLAGQIEIIMKHFKNKDGETVSDRVPPMALVAHSGAGKTRALKELSKALQTNYDNLSVIYITFNSSTDFRLKESTRPLDSLLARIAFAIADPNVIQGRPFHDINSTLQFVTTSKEIDNWLKDKPCILCIDELNNLIPSQRLDEPDMREVANFLKDVFLVRANRYFIFSSHVKATTLNLTYFMSSASDREVYVAEFPVFESTTEVSEVLKDRSPVHPMIYGNSPGLAYVTQKTPTYPSTRVEQCLKSLTTTPSASEVINNLFSGECSSLSEFDTITRISSNHRVWIPVFLIELFKSNKLSNLNIKYKIQAENVLDLLGRAKLDSGEAWEVVVLCTLFFRILDCLLTNQPTNPSQIPYYGWIPSLPPNFTIDVQYPPHDLKSVISKLSKPGSSPSVILSYPKQSDFANYDILVAVTYSSTEPVKIWGYQCKAGELPTEKPNPSVTTSIVLRSHDMDANGRSSAVKSGWKVAGMMERNSLLGPTFAPLRLMEKPGGSVILEADDNTTKCATTETDTSKKRKGEPLVDDSTAKKQDTKK
jgi:hypothetical protein